ncbi:MAG: hypothetical protein ACK4S5_07055, partial [Sphingobium yanoikuyae]
RGLDHFIPERAIGGIIPVKELKQRARSHGKSLNGGRRSTSQSYAGCSATKILADLDQSLHPLGFLRIYRWPRIAVSDGGLRAG